MKFHLDYTSDWSGERNRVVDLKSLDDLIQLIKSEGHRLIVSQDDMYGAGALRIEVYDGYRE